MVSYARVPFPSHMRDSILDGVETRLRDASLRLREVRQAIADPAQFVRNNVPVPDFLPPVFDIRATSDGDTWVRLSGTPTSTQWVRIQENGHQTIVRFPPSFELHDAHDTTAWGVIRDSLDVQLLAAFSLQN